MATNDDKNLRQVYETLRREGYTPPEYEKFRQDMTADKNLRGVYETLRREGYTPPGLRHIPHRHARQSSTGPCRAVCPHSPDSSRRPVGSVSRPRRPSPGDSISGKSLQRLEFRARAFRLQ